MKKITKKKPVPVTVPLTDKELEKKLAKEFKDLEKKGGGTVKISDHLEICL